MFDRSRRKMAVPGSVATVSETTGPERAKTRLFGAREFVVLAVADEPGVRDVNAQPPRRLQVDRRIGLGQSNLEREHSAVEPRRKGTLGPGHDVFREAVADDAKAQAPAAKVFDRREDVRVDRSKGRAFARTLSSQMRCSMASSAWLSRAITMSPSAWRKDSRPARTAGRRVFHCARNASRAHPNSGASDGDSGGWIPGFGDQRLEQVEKDRSHHRRARRLPTIGTSGAAGNRTLFTSPVDLARPPRRDGHVFVSTLSSGTRWTI